MTALAAAVAKERKGSSKKKAKRGAQRSATPAASQASHQPDGQLSPLQQRLKDAWQQLRDYGDEIAADLETAAETDEELRAEISSPVRLQRFVRLLPATMDHFEVIPWYVEPVLYQRVQDLWDAWKGADAAAEAAIQGVAADAVFEADCLTGEADADKERQKGRGAALASSCSSSALHIALAATRPALGLIWRTAWP